MMNKIEVYLPADDGTIQQITIDLDQRFKYHGQSLNSYTIEKEDEDSITIVESYGPGAVATIYYKKEQFCKDEALYMRNQKLYQEIPKLMGRYKISIDDLRELMSNIY